MNQLLIEALAASLPLAALALLAAWAVDVMGASLRLRLAAWTGALLLPAAPVPAVLAIHALSIPTPFAALQAPPEPVIARVEPIDMAARPSRPVRRPPIAELLLALAGAGAVLRLGQLVLGLNRVARLRAASAPIPDPELAARLGQGVRLADTEAPVLAGLRRPTILLPRRLLDALSPDQAALVCAHERAHLAAGDHLVHLMEETMVRVFWFNPLMAATRERLAAAREEACDARTLLGCDDARRRAYAQTLIAALKLAGRTEAVAAFTGFRRHGAERRLKAILKPSGPGSWRACAAAILAGVGLTAMVGGFSLAVAAEPKPVTSDPLPPPPPATPLDPSDAASASATALATPPPPGSAGANEHKHVVVVMQRGPNAVARVKDVEDGKQNIQTMTFNDQDWQDGHLRPEALAKIPPEERAQIEAAMKQAHDAMEKEKARAIGAHVYPLTAAEQQKLHDQVEEALQHADQAMAQTRQQLAQNDGRVLMRCKLGPDGKAQDCVNAIPGPIMRYEFRRVGPDGAQPPMPPEPPPPPPPGAG